MLVLSRFRGQKIVIGNVTLVVLSVSADKVRLGFEAPREVNITRAELLPVQGYTPERTETR